MARCGSTEADGKERAIPADKVLVAVGRRPRASGFGLEKLDLTMSGPFVRIDDQCATSMRNVWAIGDVTGEPMLAHRAMAQGDDGRRDHRRREARLRPHRHSCDLLHRPGDRRRRARARGRQGGAWRDPRRPLSVPRQRAGDDAAGRRRASCASSPAPTTMSSSAFTQSGAGVSELSAAFSLALEMGARLEDIALTIHAHPDAGRSLPRGGADRARRAAAHVSETIARRPILTLYFCKYLPSTRKRLPSPWKYFQSPGKRNPSRRKEKPNPLFRSF